MDTSELETAIEKLVQWAGHMEYKRANLPLYLEPGESWDTPEGRAAAETRLATERRGLLDEAGQALRNFQELHSEKYDLEGEGHDGDGN